eukprot:2635545-Pleurochrysis_carterae.AAC.4
MSPRHSIMMLFLCVLRFYSRLLSRTFLPLPPHSPPAISLQSLIFCIILSQLRSQAVRRLLNHTSRFLSHIPAFASIYTSIFICLLHPTGRASAPGLSSCFCSNRRSSRGCGTRRAGPTTTSLRRRGTLSSRARRTRPRRACIRAASTRRPCSPLFTRPRRAPSAPHSEASADEILTKRERSGAMRQIGAQARIWPCSAHRASQFVVNVASNALSWFCIFQSNK